MKAVIGTFLLTALSLTALGKDTPKIIRIAIVDSYHKEYLWSQETQKGFFKALNDYGLKISSNEQKLFIKSNYIKTNSAEIKKWWMNTKRKKTKQHLAFTTSKLKKEISRYSPDLILLGDDNAANYIGNQFIDTKIPVVFWGVNGTPMKYNLLETKDEPGHNVTGVYQAGYFRESLQLLKSMMPKATRFAILSDDTATGRSKTKILQELNRKEKLPLLLHKTVITNSYSKWKSSALKLQNEVDAFFVLNHQGLAEDDGTPVDMMTAGRWYLKNIKIPECSDEKQFVQEGMLLTVDDSGINQAFEATKIGLDFVFKKKAPETTPAFAPPPGPKVVNLQRLKQLNLKMSFDADITIKSSLALKNK